MGGGTCQRPELLSRLHPSVDRAALGYLRLRHIRHRVPIAQTDLAAVSCPSAARCVAVDGEV